jgi:hypothetical protein
LSCGVTFPDWSVVTSPAVRDALLEMVSSDHVLNRWSGYERFTDSVRVALLELYAENGHAPTIGALAERAGLSETAIRPLLDKLRHRYRHALDDPLPLLDGKTPRQAVKTKKGRAQVVGWLKLLENSEFRRAAGQGHNPYDTAWMWRELKVEDSR